MDDWKSLDQELECLFQQFEKDRAATEGGNNQDSRPHIGRRARGESTNVIDLNEWKLEKARQY